MDGQTYGRVQHLMRLNGGRIIIPEDERGSYKVKLNYKLIYSSSDFFTAVTDNMQ